VLDTSQADGLPPTATLGPKVQPSGLGKLDERFHETYLKAIDPSFVIPGCALTGDSRSECRPGIHSPCGGYGFRARV